LRDEERQLALVQPGQMHVGVARKAKLCPAEIDFGAAVARHPEVVAARDGIVEADLRPFVRAVFGREIQRPADDRHAADAAGRIVLGCPCGRRERCKRAGDDRKERRGELQAKHCRHGGSHRRSLRCVVPTTAFDSGTLTGSAERGLVGLELGNK